jgi:hypothetical protein
MKGFTKCAVGSIVYLCGYGIATLFHVPSGLFYFIGFIFGAVALGIDFIIDKIK